MKGAMPSPLAASTAHSLGGLLGVGVLGLLAVALLVRATRADRPPSARKRDAIIGALVAVWAIAAAVWVSHQPGNPEWNSPESSLRAGFVNNCRSAAGPAVDCGCTFDKLTTQSGYDSPERFMPIAGSMQTAVDTRNAAAVPPVVVAAMQSCRVAG